ncbi:MAG: YndJ family transporter, partial [Proteobacteria bacterium]|nr:YndJ family transporter [Pseudomonadota bacterium]
SQTNKSTTLIYTLSSFLCLMAFLLIAFGINGIPYAKPAGVMILAVVVPLCIRLHIACLSRDQKFSRLLAGISLLGLICSMTLAIVHEFWRGPFPYLLDTSYMVSIHGLINAIVVIPCFFFSIFYAYGSDIEF